MANKSKNIEHVKIQRPNNLESYIDEMFGSRILELIDKELLPKFEKNAKNISYIDANPVTKLSIDIGNYILSHYLVKKLQNNQKEK